MTTRQKPTIIGLAGAAGSGKDSVRNVLELQHESGGFGFADTIRDMLRVLLVSNGCSPDYMERRDLKEVPVPGLGISYRHMAQTLGTELVRNNWGQDFWLKLAATNMASMREHGYRNFVISDVRFANEAEWVRNQGGEIWLLDRPGTAPVREHVSEAMPFTADRIIHNHGRLSDLQRTVFDALALARSAQAVQHDQPHIRRPTWPRPWR